MPATDVVFYKDVDGEAPVLVWLQELQRRNKRGFAKCVARIRRLAEMGYELRRPEADILRDGIYELRAKAGHVQHRILYFFHGRNVAILTHALTKEDKVPDEDIDRAVKRRKLFLKDPENHSQEQEVTDNAQNQRRREDH